MLFMGKLYTLLTDNNGHYALKLDNEFLYRTDETIHGDNYSRIVDHFKSPTELKTDEEFKAFIDKSVGVANAARPMFTET